MAIVKNAVKAMEAMMPEEAVKRARLAAEQKTLAIRLADLRQRRGVKQTEMKHFTQTSASRL
ncbi:MAG: XRE family transcriptional regulator, partial [Spirochaetota bacterium]